MLNSSFRGNLWRKSSLWWKPLLEMFFLQNSRLKVLETHLITLWQHAELKLNKLMPLTEQSKKCFRADSIIMQVWLKTCTWHAADINTQDNFTRCNGMQPSYTHIQTVQYTCCYFSLMGVSRVSSFISTLTMHPKNSSARANLIICLSLMTRPLTFLISWNVLT